VLVLTKKEEESNQVIGDLQSQLQIKQEQVDSLVEELDQTYQKEEKIRMESSKSERELLSQIQSLKGDLTQTK